VSISTARATSESTADVRRPAASSEAENERLEREHEQLFHELRSIIPGVEVLFAFLLTVAFTERFQQLTDLQRGVYFATFFGAGLALILLLAPSSFHRIRFRQSDKDALLRSANIEALVALALLAFSIAGAVFLITDLMFNTAAATASSATIFFVAAGLWWVYPLSRRREHGNSAGDSAP
jgi:cation transport ATPase